MQDQLLVYFSSPYTHEDKRVVKDRYREIKEICEQVIMYVPEIVPLSAIAYMHQFADLPIDDWLRRMDLRFLDASDAMLIVQMEGWSRSEGVTGEKRYCQRNSIPVFYSTPDKVVSKCELIRDEHYQLIKRKRRG